jgi:flagellar biosynthesis anti-sigma factor FlgM
VEGSRRKFQNKTGSGTKVQSHYADDLKQGGGVGSSHPNKIGSQQSPGAADTSAASSAGKSTMVEQSPASESSTHMPSLATANNPAALSTTASAVAQALSSSHVRSAKVAELQQSIASGTYTIPASDVAAKLISALLQ